MKHNLPKILSLPKIFHGILLCFISISLTAQTPTWEPAGQDGGRDVEYLIKGDTIIFRGTGTGVMTDEYLLTSGNTEWQNATTVIIQDGVKTIGKGAFIDCVFTSISIPSSVTAIGESAFENCANLHRIAMPKDVTTLGLKIFDGCPVEYIRVESKIPLSSISNLVFDGAPAPASIKLIVPEGAVGNYEKANIWKDFSIVEVLSIIPAEVSFVSTASGGQYDGTPKTPDVIVKYDGTTLTRGVDYTLEYSNNINAGSAYVTITGLFLYTKSQPKVFSIHQAPFPMEDKWPKWKVEEGKTLEESVPEGGPAKDEGVFTFTRATHKPTLNESDFTLFDLLFTPKNSNYSAVKTETTVTVIPPTGYKDRLQDEIIIYPNPFFGEVHLKGSAGCTLKVLNVAGVAVHSQQITDVDEIIRLDKLPAGLYFFRLEKAGKAKTLKVGKR
jgi:hypothetical protein